LRSRRSESARTLETLAVCEVVLRKRALDGSLIDWSTVECKGKCKEGGGRRSTSEVSKVVRVEQTRRAREWSVSSGNRLSEELPHQIASTGEYGSGGKWGLRSGTIWRSASAPLSSTSGRESTVKKARSAALMNTIRGEEGLP